MTNFPCYRAGQRITAGAASAATALAGAVVHVKAASAVLIHNPGPNLVYVRTGADDVVADDTCAPVPALALWAYDKGAGTTHIAAIAPDGDQDILVLVGQGS